MMLRIRCLSLLIIGLAACKTATVARVSSQQFLQASTQPKSLPLTASSDNIRELSGVARVQSDLTCTGVYIATGPKADHPAYLLTAGHCLINFEKDSSAFAVYRNAFPRIEPNAVQFRYFADESASKGGTDAKDFLFRMGRVHYATMKGLDLAIVELTNEDSGLEIYELTEQSRIQQEYPEFHAPRALTVLDLEKAGITPLPLATQVPGFGDPIRIVSAPADHASEKFDGFLRDHRCRHEGQTTVIEGIWHWYDLARNDCTDILPGSSGAPILNAQGEVFAIVSTSSRDAVSQDCYTGQPCELTEQSFQVAQGRNYGTVITGLKECFDQEGKLDVKRTACGLDHSQYSSLIDLPVTPQNPQLSSSKPKAWNLVWKQNEKIPFLYRFKLGSMNAMDCRDGQSYSSSKSSIDQGLQSLPLPSVPGLHALCVIAEADYARDDFTQPIVVVMNIDQRPPTLAVHLINHPLTQQPLMAVRKSCQDLAIGANLEQRKKCAVAIVSFETEAPELVKFLYGWIGPKSKECKLEDTLSQGLHASIPVNLLPANLCVWGIDGAGNRAQEPTLHFIRAATRREIIDATDVLVD